MPGKRVQFDDEAWAAVDLLARDSMRDFQELAEEAFRDLLEKHGRPVGLKAQLKQSQSDEDATAGAGAAAAAGKVRGPAEKRLRASSRRPLRRR